MTEIAAVRRHRRVLQDTAAIPAVSVWTDPRYLRGMARLCRDRRCLELARSYELGADDVESSGVTP